MRLRYLIVVFLRILTAIAINRNRRRLTVVNRKRDEKQLGLDNVAFQLDEPRIIKNDRGAYYPDRDSNSILDVQIAESEKKRATWNNSVEFLMSCIAVSVGFGNIWRFPFTAYENGGGAFLIPYVILLFLVGKPFYFLEMIIGQFSSKSSVKVWGMSPGFTGVGWAQFCSTIALATYYSSLMALTLYYLIASFSAELPWATCLKEWGDTCVDSSTKRNHNVDLITAEENVDVLNNLLNSSTQVQSSAELYFSRVVLHEKENIDDGIGLPSWQLTLCLFGSWAAICAVLFQGVKSSGRFSYFLAIFPYIVLVSLLIRAVTLDGAIDGILYFITPKWSKLLEPTVWYAAVTQCFFSLSVCFGSIITYSSHNDFKHNIYRDVLIITSLDTVTSLLAGCTIFGILGNLAYELGVDDISKVVRGGAGLAFVSYPDAIAKFSFLPQLFAVLFFVMMFVLGVGSAVGMVTGIITVINEQFPKLKTWQIVVPACCLGFAIGTVYVTPGGQFILTLVDYYGASFVVFILASFEMTGVIWVYGLENFMDDLIFMLDRKPSIYWRICWFIVTPLILITIFIYTVATLSPVTYGQRSLPASAHAAGWTLLCIGVLQIPLWMLIAMLKKRELPCMQMVKAAFAPVDGWGPQEVQQRKNWKIFKEERARAREKRIQPIWQQMLYVLLNKEPK
ncbi:sodium-dependent nutrient amino acid transporter 1-like isoform X1 [Ooceraea biroi]|uniref:sodium-dependent nutrient amino acid transporter 1-like isoform X1 n=1 Tax=Ooceraea biroi TaxID=2015173 RepID=UPI0005B9CDB6|nr:sodium-dependent nutrient amino acid transporter 1-like isoform X1 [Ooceraea biroi]